MENQGPNNNSNGNPNRGGNGDKNNRNGQMIMAFIMVSLVALFVMSMITNQFAQMRTEEVSYSEFLDMVTGEGEWKGHSVESVQIGSYQIDITLKSDGKVPYEKTYYCGIVNDNTLIPLLKKYNVEINGVIPDNTSTMIIGILSYLIPIGVILVPAWHGDAQDGAKRRREWASARATRRFMWSVKRA